MASDFSLTCESSSEKEKRKKTPKKVTVRGPKLMRLEFNLIIQYSDQSTHMEISRYKNGNEHKSSFCSVVPMTVQSKQSKPRPTPRDEQSAQDWMEAQEKMRMLKDRHSFLLNPRFLPLNTPHGATSLVKPRNKAANVTNERCSESPPCLRSSVCCQNIELY